MNFDLLAITATMVALLTGCGPDLTTMKMGAQFPPKPADCAITWENLDPMQPSTQYQNIGTVMVRSVGSGADDVSPATKTAIDHEACRVGADAVARSMSASNYAGSTSTYMLLRHREAGSPATATAWPASK